MIQVKLHSFFESRDSGHGWVECTRMLPAIPSIGTVLILDGLWHVVDAIAFRAEGAEIPEVIIQSVVKCRDIGKQEALDLFRELGWDVPDEVPSGKSQAAPTRAPRPVQK